VLREIECVKLTAIVVRGFVLLHETCVFSSMPQKHIIYVGPPYCLAKMYAGRITCCPWRVTLGLLCWG